VINQNHTRTTRKRPSRENGRPVIARCRTRLSLGVSRSVIDCHPRLVCRLLERPLMPCTPWKCLLLAGTVALLNAADLRAEEEFRFPVESNLRCGVAKVEISPAP